MLDVKLVRTLDARLDASGRLGWQPADLKLRRSNVPLGELTPALEKNGRDEVVLRGDNGDHYVLDAIRLGGFQVGDTIQIGRVRGEVVHIDKDPERFAGVAVLGGTVVALPIVISCAVSALGLALTGPGAIAIGAVTLAIGHVASALADHRRSDDRRLAEVTQTLAATRTGDESELAAQVS